MILVLSLSESGENTIDTEEEFIQLGRKLQLPKETSRQRGEINKVRQRVRRVVSTNKELAEQIITQSGLDYTRQGRLRREFGLGREKPGRPYSQITKQAEEQLMTGSSAHDASIETGVSYSHSRRLARQLEQDGYKINRTRKKRRVNKTEQLREQLLLGESQAVAAKNVGASRSLTDKVAAQLRSEGYKVTGRHKINSHDTMNI